MNRKLVIRLNKSCIYLECLALPFCTQEKDKDLHFVQDHLVPKNHTVFKSWWLNKKASKNHPFPPTQLVSGAGSLKFHKVWRSIRSVQASCFPKTFSKSWFGSTLRFGALKLQSFCFSRFHGPMGDS